MKSCSVVIGLLIGSIIAAATGYFDPTDITKVGLGTNIYMHSSLVSSLTLYRHQSFPSFGLRHSH